MEIEIDTITTIITIIIAVIQEQNYPQRKMNLFRPLEIKIQSQVKKDKKKGEMKIMMKKITMYRKNRQETGIFETKISMTNLQLMKIKQKGGHRLIVEPGNSKKQKILKIIII